MDTTNELVARRNAQRPSPQKQKLEPPRSPSPSSKETGVARTTALDTSHTRSRRPRPVDSERDDEVVERAANEKTSGSAISTALDSGHARRLRSPSSTAVVDVVQNAADKYGIMIRGSAYPGHIQHMRPSGSIRHTEDHDYVSQLDEIEGGGYASNTTGERTSGVDELRHLTGFPLPLLSGQLAPSRVLQDEVVDRHSNPIPGGLDERHDAVHSRVAAEDQRRMSDRGDGNRWHDANRQYTSRPPLIIKFTGYRILNSCALLVFGTWKGVAAYQGNAIISNTLDVIFGVVLTLFLYWLGHFEAVDPPCLPWLFHEDYAAKLLSHRASRPSH